MRKTIVKRVVQAVVFIGIFYLGYTYLFRSTGVAWHPEIPSALLGIGGVIFIELLMYKHSKNRRA